MSVTKTFKNLGSDADKFDRNAYAKDSTSDNFKEDYGFVPKSDNERLRESRESTQQNRAEYLKMMRDSGFTQMNKGPVKVKNKKQIDIIQVENGPVYRYKKGFQGEMADDSKYSTTSELNEMLKEKGVARQQARQLIKAKQIVRQKLRSDRLAKKEMRVAEMKSRLKRLQSADRTASKVQRSLSRILRQKRSEQVNDRLYAGYSGYTPQQGILNTPNLFTQSDGRTNAVRSGNIMDTPNLLMQTKGKTERKRWF